MAVSVRRFKAYPKYKDSGVEWLGDNPARTPTIRERMAGLDLEIQEMNPAEYAALIRSDYERRGRIVKASGWKPTANY